jgi:diguanylate cyclase (GGDEF)-like protein
MYPDTPPDLSVRLQSTQRTAAIDPFPESDGRCVAANVTVLSGSEAGRFFLLEGGRALVGRSEEADVPLVHPGISRQHARIAVEDSGLVLEDLKSRNGTFVEDAVVTGSVALPPRCRVRLGHAVVLEVAALDTLGLAAFRKLGQALHTDPLTGVGNRRALTKRLAEEVSFARRERRLLGLLLLDLDHFKRVNDRLGHAVGDLVLIQVGQALVQNVRAEDAVFRYGGEEFCVLLRGQGRKEIRQAAERLRQAVADLEILTLAGTVKVTISVGVAGLLPDEPGDEESLLLWADQALYRAKERGRDRVEVSARRKTTLLPVTAAAAFDAEENTQPRMKLRR